MELTAQTMATPITNYRFRLVEQLGQYVLPIFNFFSFFFSHSLLNRYDLYWAKSGTFNRYGDGGFINVRTPSFKPVSQQYDFI